MTFPDLVVALKDTSPFTWLALVVLGFVWMFDRLMARVLALLERIAGPRRR